MMVSDRLEFTQTVGQWIVAGEVAPIVMLWFSLLFAKQLLRTLLTYPFGDWFLSARPRVIRCGLHRARVGVLIDLLAAPLPAIDSDHAPLSIRFTVPGWGPGLQALGFGAGVAVVEELLFRGLPLAVAALLGLHPAQATLLVMATTVLGALTHGHGKGIAIVLTDGWLLAALWLVGHWPLAVLFAAIYGAFTGCGGTLVDLSVDYTDQSNGTTETRPTDDDPAAPH